MKENKKEELLKIENCLSSKEKIKVEDKIFEKLMFIYSVAIKEISTKLEILKDEFHTFYDYELIDHINTRIKQPNSIINKMKDKGCELTYAQMIENINDIAGVRVICPLKNDIFTIRNLIEKLPGVKIIKQKDYVTNPKKSGYASYHLIAEVPITLSQKIMYVKVEIQIRTMAMDFWASVEHKAKYKTEIKPTKRSSKELVECAKMISKLDDKMMLLRN